MTTPPTKIDPDDLPNAFTGKTLPEIDAIEFGGRVLVPAAFDRRNSKGEAVATRVLIGECRMADRGLAKIDAVSYVQTLVKHPVRTVADAEAAVGADVFEQFDTAAIVARCTFDLAPPHPRHQTLAGLLDTYGIREVLAMFRRLDALTGMLSTDEHEIADARFWAMVETIARVKHTGPLAVMLGDEQRSFITRMAVEALSSRRDTSRSP